MASKYTSLIGIACDESVAVENGFQKTMIPWGFDGVSELVIIPLFETDRESYSVFTLDDLQSKISSDKYSEIMNAGGRLCFGCEQTVLVSDNKKRKI
jgi:hypothetical protein